ncbi:hypothetical protein D9615_005606 [Tricholomella constricta]|uniref:F-box domain-containing protein n=1 Tax=Tricholomella constricta TaxID=117010 RepID=A0A8H5HEL5_9AGAR|nr:hypothetical protein D9615_005606 [Tricholomella constricta]
MVGKSRITASTTTSSGSLSSNFDMGPHFLPELEQLILSHIPESDKETLRTCATIRRDWVGISRAADFSKVTLDEKNSLSFLALLQSPLCTIAIPVRSLHIDDLYPTSEDRYTWIDNDIPKIVSKLPCVTSLSIRSNSRAYVREETLDALISAYSDKLTSLSIMRAKFVPTFANAMRFFCAFQVLESLEPLVSWDDNAAPDGNISLPPRLRNLKVGAAVAAHIFPWTLAHQPIPPISRLEISEVTMAMAPDISKFITAISAELLELLVRFDYGEQGALDVIHNNMSLRRRGMLKVIKPDAESNEVGELVWQSS